MDNFETNLLEKLKIRSDLLRADIKKLQAEFDEIKKGIQSLCPHSKITKTVYEYIDGGPTFHCDDCDLYESGYSGPIAKLSWKY